MLPIGKRSLPKISPLQFTIAAFFILPILAMSASAQPGRQAASDPENSASSPAPAVPQQMRYDGKLPTRSGDTVEAVFRIYSAPEGGDPVWTETQHIVVAEDGSYTVLLGSASASGLPQTVFTGGAARWLGVSIERGAEQDRTLLSSVPYAMKSADAESLAGHPAKDFVTQDQLLALQPAQPATAPQPETGGSVTGTGAANTIPLWTSSATLGNSAITQSGTSIGINIASPASTLDVNGGVTVRGSLNLPAPAKATASAGQHSSLFEFSSSAWNSATSAAQGETFFMVADPTGNDTASPSAVLNFQFKNGSAAPSTIFSVAGDGIMTFSPSQKFPGTLSGVSAASPLTATTTSGTVALGLNLTTLETSLNAQYAQLGAANTFTKPITFATGQAFPGTGTITGVTAGAGLTGGGTSGAVKLALDTTAVPTLTGSPVFNGSAGDGLSGDTAGTTVGTAGVVGLAGSGNTNGYGGIAGVWGNASAHVGVLGTSDQYPGVQGVSNTGYGVQGSSTSNTAVSGTSSSGAGVAGSSTTGAGIVGYTAGSTIGTAGTFGIAGARTSFNGIAGIWGDAAAHIGVFGSSNQYAGVSGASVSGPGVQGASTSGSGGSFTSSGAAATLSAVNSATSLGGAVYAASSASDVSTIYSSSTGSGGYAISGVAIGGADSSGVPPVGVYGYSGGGNGIHGVSGSTSGILAETSSTSAGDAALYAFSHNNASGVYAFSTNKMGIHAIAAGSSQTGAVSSTFVNGPAAVWGDTSTAGYAVAGTTDDGIAGEFLNSSESQGALYVVNGNSFGGSHVADFAGGTGSCSIFGDGDVLCTGTVSSAVATRDGARSLQTYSVQSAENWYEDAGSAQLVDGVAHVDLDPAFGQTVNTAIEYHVFLTPGGDSDGLYVTNKTAAGFEVHEQHGGHSNIPFDYRIMAKRLGHENERLVDVTEQMKKQAERRDRTRRPDAASADLTK